MIHEEEVGESETHQDVDCETQPIISQAESMIYDPLSLYPENSSHPFAFNR